MAMSNLFKFFLSFAMLLPAGIACGHDIAIVNQDKDDSDVIILRLKEAMDSYGLISVEQHTGRLLFNPLLEKLKTMPLKHKFLIPAMIVNQSKGLNIITELPFSCFILSGDELAADQYKGFKQYETARYLRDVKAKSISRALLCQAVGALGVRAWGTNLDLNLDDDRFVFGEHIGLGGERFYYFLNSDGLFEMYL